MIHSKNSIHAKAMHGISLKADLQEVILPHTFGPSKTPTGK